MSVTFDSWAWIEYFKGQERGKQPSKYIESEEQIYTPSICLMEIKTKYIREGKPYEDRLTFIEERSTIKDIDKDTALEAANLISSEGLHSMDALVYACARLTKTNLLTGDPHFKGKKDIEFLG